MHVVATAGHVDHGKSTLVRALTGMEPDRFAEEKRRGMTIDLGYAWTALEEETLAFVDVPGHERFIATMLAGLGPSPAVLFVVAADEGWRRQSEEHLAAVHALGLQHGLLAVTRSDLADPGPTLQQARARIADSSLGEVAAVSVSATTGDGLPELRVALHGLVTGLPPAQSDGRVRLWVDRSFTIRGAGTVVTGTLGSGRIRVDDELMLAERRVRVRGLESLGEPRQEVAAVARVALNLRGVEVEQIGRGDALLTLGSWHTTTALDVRCFTSEAEVTRLPNQLVLHLGTAAVPVRVRPLGGDVVRLLLHRPLPVQPADRIVLRDPGRHVVAAGAVVLDVDPPVLRRRGAAAARAATLSAVADNADRAAALAAQVRRRGAARRSDLEAVGISTADTAAVQVVGAWLVDPGVWQDWQRALADAVDERARAMPLDPRLSVEAARRLVAVPDRTLLVAAAEAAGLLYADGRVSRAEMQIPALGAAENGLVCLEQHLAQAPFAAPEKPDLDHWGLGLRELAAAERTGRVVRLAPDLVLLPTGPALAMRVLAVLPQPFTTSQARQALGTTRRVAIPLLEHLDRRGWTVRLDGGHRRVKRG
ncbi:MAG TPA: selenocysteine-specific translation elongation factor [Propionibacteriaceae bacterium]|nr:selenocysteine-specific translation elongation factor [Propionibacteriaceae bacterium]